jgi:preprotein translocase subunit SecD
MSRRGLLTSMLFMIVLAVVAVAVPIASHTKPTLGLDLQGGFSVVLQAKPVNGELPSESAVERAKEIIRQRVDGLGVAEPDITRQGRTVVVQLPGLKNRSKAESVIGCTARLEFRPVLAASANPNYVDPDATTTTAGATTTTKAGDTTTTAAGATTTSAADASTTTVGGGDETGMGAVGLNAGEGALPSQFKPTTTTTTPPTTTAPPTTVPETTTTVAGDTTTTVAGDTTTTTVAGSGTSSTSSACGGSSISSLSAEKQAELKTAAFGATEGDLMVSKDETTLYLLGPVGLTGEALSSAEAEIQSGQWLVNASIKKSQRTTANELFNMCNSGLATCPDLTGQSGPGSVAIILDDQVLSAPAVQTQNLADSNFSISGSFTESEAKNLALVLRYGSLPVVFEQAALQQVSATLGTDSLHAGLIAGAIGIAALAIYMILYYRGFGLTVVASLFIWMAMMYGLVCFLSESQGLALTLSGITGIIVSVGTTVDTYVVVFERIKDEVRGGRSIRSATERGYQSGIKTVFTANGAAFIGAFLLWWLTVGPVRGFAYFLGLSVILDLFVAVVFTRPLILLASRSDRFARNRFFGVGTATDQVDRSTRQTSGSTATDGAADQKGGE